MPKSSVSSQIRNSGCPIARTKRFARRPKLCQSTSQPPTSAPCPRAKSSWKSSTQQASKAIASPILSSLGPTYRPYMPSKGITRHLSSAKSQSLISKGVEMVAANLNDPSRRRCERRVRHLRRHGLLDHDEQGDRNAAEEEHLRGM